MVQNGKQRYLCICFYATGHETELHSAKLILNKENKCITLNHCQQQRRQETSGKYVFQLCCLKRKTDDDVDLCFVTKYQLSLHQVTGWMNKAALEKTRFVLIACNGNFNLKCEFKSDSGSMQVYVYCGRT